MDVKLDSLIEKIKKEGVDEARQNADKIIADARKQADQLVEKAKKDADALVSDGKKQVDQYQKNAEADLRQAARNSELLLKQEITALFDRVFKKEVADALTPEFLNKIILEMAKGWTEESEVEIAASESDAKDLEKILFSGLKKELHETIHLKPGAEIRHGFRIGLKDKQVYYDFSDEAIAEVLQSLINPRLVEILKG
jgi:V/A-type H+-transporting ATPase subunit E